MLQGESSASGYEFNKISHCSIASFIHSIRVYYIWRYALQWAAAETTDDRIDLLSEDVRPYSINQSYHQ